MALNKPALQATIKALMLDMKTKEIASFDEFAQRLADAIDVYVKTGTITTVVTGVCATPVGPGTISGSGTGTIA